MRAVGRVTARGWVLAACALVLGTAAHGEAGGVVGAPSPGVLAVAVAVGAVAALLGHRVRGVAATVAVLGLGQVALHLSMPAADAHGGMWHHMPGMPDMPGMSMGDMGDMGHAATGGWPTTGLISGLTPAMIVAHGLVTVVLAVAVVGADRGVTLGLALRTAFAAVGGWLAALLVAPPVPAVRPTPALWSFRAGVATVGTGVLVVRVHRRRGPPRVVA